MLHAPRDGSRSLPCLRVARAGSPVGYVNTVALMDAPGRAAGIAAKAGATRLDFQNSGFVNAMPQIQKDEPTLSARGPREGDSGPRDGFQAKNLKAQQQFAAAGEVMARSPCREKGAGRHSSGRLRHVSERPAVRHRLGGQESDITDRVVSRLATKATSLKAAREARCSGSSWRYSRSRPAVTPALSERAAVSGFVHRCGYGGGRWTFVGDPSAP